MVAWDDQSLGGRSAPRAALLFQKLATWPMVVSVCLSEGAATDFLPRLPYFSQLAHCFPFILNGMEVLEVCFEILEIPQVVGPVPAQLCVKSSLHGGLQHFHLERQMREQLSQTVEALGELLKACGGGGGLSSTLHSAGWGQPHGRDSTAGFT